MKLWLSLLLVAVFSALGFGFGYWYAAPSLLSPEGLAGLASQLSDRRAKQAQERYSKVQEELQKQQEQSREELSKARKDTEKVSRRLKESSRRLQAEREVSEKRAQELARQARVAEEEAAEAGRALEAAIVEAGLDLSEELDASAEAHNVLAETLRSEINELRDVVKFQTHFMSSQDALISKLRVENSLLLRNLEIAERRYEEAEGRIGQLSGRRIRFGPAVMVGAVRGFGGRWEPGVAVGVAITW